MAAISAIFRPAAAPNDSNCPMCLSEFNEGEIVLAHIASEPPPLLSRAILQDPRAVLGTNIMENVPRHYYHQNCLGDWIRQKARNHLNNPVENGPPDCPQCRVPINLRAGVLGYNVGQLLPHHILSRRWQALKPRIKTFLYVTVSTFALKFVTTLFKRTLFREIINPLDLTMAQNINNIFDLINLDSNSVLKTAQIIAVLAANLLMNGGAFAICVCIAVALYAAFASIQIFIGQAMRWQDLNNAFDQLHSTDIPRFCIFLIGAVVLDKITQSFSMPWALTANVVYACATGLMEACLPGPFHEVAHG